MTLKKIESKSLISKGDMQTTVMCVHLCSTNMLCYI